MITLRTMSGVCTLGSVPCLCKPLFLRTKLVYIINMNNSPTCFYSNFSAPGSCVCSITPAVPILSFGHRSARGRIGDTYIGKGMMLMLRLHAPDARELTPCPLVSLQCATRFRQILWRRSGTMGDRSCQLPRMPLPDFVIALTFVIGVKFGSSARTFFEICCAFKG